MDEAKDRSYPMEYTEEELRRLSPHFSPEFAKER